MNLNSKDGSSNTAAGATSPATTIEDGCIPDVTEVDIRKQYLVENPVNREAYYDLKQYAPCRLGIGKAGARYKNRSIVTVPCSTFSSTGCSFLRCRSGVY